MEIAVNTVSNPNPIIAIRHPHYDRMKLKWEVFRDTWVGGSEYVEKYTKSYSLRESAPDFAVRKSVTPSATHAKSQVAKIKNAISQRMSEIVRKDGPRTYMEAIRGDDFGVDLQGSSMNVFMDQKVLQELCPMGRVGVYIDKDVMPENATLQDTISIRPYLYTYQTEDILSWTMDDSSAKNEFKALFLREYYAEIDEETGLTKANCYRYRVIRKVPDGFTTKFYNKLGKQVDKANKESSEVYFVKLQAIPFVLFELSQSLLNDIAGHQIALLNLGSTDMDYALKSNHPFYTEQYDPRSDENVFKTSVVPTNNRQIDGVIVNQPETAPIENTAAVEVTTGVAQGRRYAKGLNAPAFVHPSPEPLKVSMEKQANLIKDIERILNTTLRNLTANSVELEKQDNQGFESGLHNIGLELEHGERKIVEIWAMYENDKTTATVTYPKTYSLKTDSERRAEAKELDELRSKIPSPLYQREMAKQSATTLLQDKIPHEKLEAIREEIDNAETMTSSAEEIAKDMENGLVDAETASIARGYKKGVVKKAQKEMVDRLALIALSQSKDKGMGAARGVPDGGDPLAGKKEKALAGKDASGAPVDNTRGDGK